MGRNGKQGLNRNLDDFIVDDESSDVESGPEPDKSIRMFEYSLYYFLTINHSLQTSARPPSPRSRLRPNSQLKVPS